MLLELDVEIFADDHDGEGAGDIFLLLRFIIEGRHDWFPSPQLSDVATQYSEKAFPTMKIFHEVLRSASTASAWRGGRQRPTVRVTAKSLGPLTSDLGKPAVVIVENSRNDGSFLKAVFDAYDCSLSEAIRKDWLQIDHAGGTGEQVHLADEAATRFTEVCRVIVIKDNDKGLTIAAVEELSAWPPRVPHIHVWCRLEVENYLPDAVLLLSDHPEAQTLVSYLRAMTDEQQRLIDMKHGLARSTSSAQVAAFQGLEPDCKRVWHSGFGGRFPKPLIPETIALTAEDFRNLGHDVHEELVNLLSKIKSLT